MKVERIASKTIRAQVYEQLKDKVISAEILPGEGMTLQGLAQGFGVSLMPRAPVADASPRPCRDRPVGRPDCGAGSVR